MKKGIVYKECSEQKTYLPKVDGSAQKPRGRHLTRPCRPFWSPLAAILYFACGAVLQGEPVPQKKNQFFSAPYKVKPPKKIPVDVL